MFTCAPICLACLEFHSSDCLGLTDMTIEHCPEFFSVTFYRCEMRKECPQARGANPCIFALAHPGPCLPEHCEEATRIKGQPTVVKDVPTVH